MLRKAMKRCPAFRVLVALMALVILCASPLHILSECHAVAVEALIGAAMVMIIGAQLIASGVKFASQVDMRAAASAIIDYLHNDDPTTFTLLQHFAYANMLVLEKGSNAVVRMSQSLWDKIIGKNKDAVLALPGKIPSSCFENWDNGFLPYFQNKYYAVKNFSGTTYMYSSSTIPSVSIFNSSPPQLHINMNDSCWGYCKPSDKGFNYSLIYASAVCHARFDDVISGIAWNFAVPITGCDDGVTYYLWPNPTGVSGTAESFIHDVPYSTDGKIDVTGICALPDNIAHTILMPDMPYMQDGEIVYPDIPLEPADSLGNIADLPGYTDTADVPFDLPIDTTTGKVVDAPDVPDVPDVPEVGLSDILAAIEAATAAVGSITDAITKPLDFPTDFKLSLPSLVATKFPFCIPFDIARLVALFEAEPVEPVFVIPFKYGTIVDTEIRLDLTKFDSVITIIRWGETILFVGGLMLITSKVIKW